MILATNMLTIWEYEDFLLENYKQRLIESIKLNHLSTDNDNLNSTLQNVVIETNDSIDGLIRYRSMIKGVKVSIQITLINSSWIKNEASFYYGNN
ncbi:hypothetical protein QQG55_34285 [Brugia pahangi]